MHLGLFYPFQIGRLSLRFKVLQKKENQKDHWRKSLEEKVLHLLNLKFMYWMVRLGTEKESPTVEACKQPFSGRKLAAQGSPSQEISHQRETRNAATVGRPFWPLLPHPPSEDSHWWEALWLSRGGKAFSHRSSLSRHLMSHTGEPSWVQCLWESFFRPFIPDCTSATHTGEKPFNAASVKKPSLILTRHQRIHTEKVLMNVTSAGKPLARKVFLRDTS